MRPRQFQRSHLVEAALVGVVGIVIIGAVVGMKIGHAAPSSDPGLDVAAQTSPSAIAEETELSTSTVAATPVAGQPIALPSGNNGGLTLIAVDTAPPFSQDQAMAIVANGVAAFGLGGEYDGRTVSVSASFGLATVGTEAADGSWVGPANLPLANGESLNRIIDRPLWVVDYGNIPYFLPDGQIINHAVYLVDADTNAVIWKFAYQGE